MILHVGMFSNFCKETISLYYKTGSAWPLGGHYRQVSMYDKTSHTLCYITATFIHFVSQDFGNIPNLQVLRPQAAQLPYNNRR